MGFWGKKVVKVVLRVCFGWMIPRGKLGGFERLIVFPFDGILLGF